MEEDRTGFIKGMAAMVLPASLFVLESPKSADEKVWNDNLNLLQLIRMCLSVGTMSAGAVLKFLELGGVHSDMTLGLLMAGTAFTVLGLVDSGVLVVTNSASEYEFLER